MDKYVGTLAEKFIEENLSYDSLKPMTESIGAKKSAQMTQDPPSKKKKVKLNL